MLNQSSTGKRTRFAIYTRYSSEMQNDLSLEAQERICREAIAERGGVVTAVYSDSAKSGWSLDRDGFNELRRAGERNKVDAVMFWKFDRLARNHEHAVMIKMLLRHEYGIKLYCVEGFSEDDDDSPYSAMMEQLLAVISAFYSKNLSTETKRGKKQRAIKGEFNGSVAPLGYFLVTKRESNDNNPYGLYIDPNIAPIVAEAFLRYSSGKYSDLDIAEWMNTHQEIQELRQGKQLLGKEMVRDLLQNRVYTGRVPYSETIYSGSLGQGKRSTRNSKEWFEGKHAAIISDELYDQCQKVRSGKAVRRQSIYFTRTYLLSDRVYCAHCIGQKSSEINDPRYGKMRAKWDARLSDGYYRCIARDRGYGKCNHRSVLISSVDHQVVQALKHLNIPIGYRERVERAVRSRVENAGALKRMEEIQKIVERINFSWEQGLITPEDYINKRTQFQKELESLRPIDHDELLEAADLLENFATYWESSSSVQNPDEARRQLLGKIIDRVFVYDNKVIAIALHGEYNVILDEEVSVGTDIKRKLSGGNDKINGGNITNNISAICGSDGIRTRDLHLDRVAC